MTWIVALRGVEDYLWMVLFLAGGLVWIVSGRDPLLWLAKGILVLRAALAAACVVAWEAVQEWWDRVPAHLESSKQEVQ